jgi:tetratricopeptide (TPR) repeat protein
MRAVLVAWLLLTTASPAVADGARDRARKHFAEARRLQEAGDYDMAIAEYQRAHEIAPHPELSFNIGQCHRLKGDKRGAIAAYERYLAEEPDGRAAAEAAAHVAALKEALADEEAARSPEEAPERVPLAAPPGAAAAPSRPAPIGEPPAAVRPGHGLRTAGLVTAGGGALLLAGGVGFALRASSIAAEVDGLEDAWDPGLYASGQHAQTASVAMVAAGSVAVATGAILYYLGLRAGRSAAISVVPSAVGGGLRVRF